LITNNMHKTTVQTKTLKLYLLYKISTSIYNSATCFHNTNTLLNHEIISIDRNLYEWNVKKITVVCDNTL